MTQSISGEKSEDLFNSSASQASRRILKLQLLQCFLCWKLHEKNIFTKSKALHFEYARKLIYLKEVTQPFFPSYTVARFEKAFSLLRLYFVL